MIGKLTGEGDAAAAAAGVQKKPSARDQVGTVYTKKLLRRSDFGAKKV